MAARAEIVTVAMLLVLRVGAPASFPGWWSDVERGRQHERAAQAQDEVQVVYLPALLPREAQSAADRAHDDIPLPYNFDAFGRSFELQLVPNRRLVAPQFGVWSERGQERPLSAVDVSCHFLHAGPNAVAAFSACKDHSLHGLIVVDNSTYEVRPLPTGSGRAENGDRTAHMIRRAPPPPAPLDDARPLRPRVRRPRRHPPRSNARQKPGPPNYTIEIALFLDEAAYKIFYPFMNYDEADLRDMLLAYINGVQALYQHSSLGTHVQLSLVRLTFLRSQPRGLPPHAERGRLLDAFCAYQRSLNVEDDDDPDHWDMALLLSGLDFYSEEGGRRNGVTMGLAPVGGVCLAPHACVVAEFGAQDLLGRPYPSAGFTSVYILAHEIGHNLGMHHDGTGNSCARDGFIMSPSRGTSGEATWSECSAQVVADLQWATCLQDGGDELDTPDELRHEKFGGAPGAVWGVKRQCETFLRDRDAAAVPAAGASSHCAQLSCRSPHRAGFYHAGPALPGTPCGHNMTFLRDRDAAAVPAAGASSHCAQLSCRSPHRAGFYHAGPALPGTPCGHNMWCQGGECVPSHSLPSSTTAKPSITNDINNTSNPTAVGGWSSWREASCQSGCTLRSRGFRERRRTCQTAAGCEGTAYDVTLCDDTKVCGKKTRVSAGELASRKCGAYAARVPALDPRGGGLQAPHDPTRMWMGCAVFCRRASGGGFYAPRVELNDAGLEPYFPDGTWCHHDGSQDYYCLQHHCLPENFKMTAQWHIWELPSEDIDGAFNARARQADPAEALGAYLSLDEAGVPLVRSALPPRLPDEPETSWEVVDYVDVPMKDTTTSL